MQSQEQGQADWDQEGVDELSVLRALSTLTVLQTYRNSLQRLPKVRAQDMALT